jgi:two-component system, chemotaxis family, CheB/CheR fusion protein
MSKSEINKPKIPSQNLFPVVGIGASAGGLDAFKKLIATIPEDSGMAYILVQHLHPQHDSALPEILQRVSKIPVIEISDNVKVSPNNIYVIPSNKMLIATDGVLKLSPREAKNRINLPIDIFFSSLAEIHQAHAIGVILSGTGADGTAGLKDIKDNGGLTLVQDPSTSSYDGMPQSAIDAGIVDFIIAPEKISEKLMELRQVFSVDAAEGSGTAKDKINEDAFRQILALLKVRVGVDFNFYKQTTVRRRIIRRTLMLQLESVKEYVDYLKKNKAELDILFQDLLIPVTSFFRDTPTFDILCETVFPEILKNKEANNPLRFWIAGCSTGQEAYSIAMCLHEYMSDHISTIKVQIFATDLSEIAIKKARNSIYSKKELEGISESRLERFFNKIDGHYQVKKNVRDMCIFAVHNFVKDPPFAKMDFISCRNVLIYLEPFLQKKAFNLFHYALNDKGILLLGKSETTGSASDMFIPHGKKDKYFGKKAVTSKFVNRSTESRETTSNDKSYFMRTKEGKTEDFQKNADDILLQRYTPVGVVVNEQYDIVEFRGATGEYLEPSSGRASLNVMKMAKEGLSFEIRNALHQVKTSKEPFVREGIPINAGKKIVTLEVVPLLNTIEIHFLILFRDTLDFVSNEEIIKKGHQNPLIESKGVVNRILQLEKELAQAREDMRRVTEEQEASNEELQSSNEELLSGSEELQSLNEELETSKEELQSTNEELITVNQELYDRNEELSQSRRFAEATLTVLHEPLLVLDNDFMVKSANAAFYRTFGITDEETLGKHLFSLPGNGWDIPELRKELSKVQHGKVQMVEVEIIFNFPTVGERVICVNIQLVTRESGEQLILLALDDITLRKNAENILAENAKMAVKERQLLQGFLNDSPAMFAILKGSDYVFEFANKAYLEFNGKKDIVGKTVTDVMPELESQGYLKSLNEVYETGNSYVAKEIPIFLNTGNANTENKFLNLSYQAIKDEAGNTSGILVFAYDVTELILGRRHVKRNADMIENMYMSSPAFVCTMMGPEHTYELVNESYQKLFGTRKIVGKPIFEALPELVGQGFDLILDNVYQTGEIFLGNEVLIWLAYDEGLEPAERYFNFSYQPIFDEDNQTTGILVFGFEVTEQIMARRMRQEDADRFRTLAETMPQKMNTKDAEGKIDYLNQQWYDYTKLNYEELKDFGWEKIIHPDDLALRGNKWKHALSTGEEFQHEQRFLRHDGIYRWHLTKVVAQKDINDNIVAWIGTHTDIDEQKVKEQQKDEFISIASHEMKTPLTTAKAYLQLLEMSVEGDETSELYAKKASDAVERLHSLITELLDASKIQNGRLNYNITTFNFNQMVENTIEDIGHSFPSHQIIKTGIITKLLWGDENRLQQVIINLLTNAIKYAPKAFEILVNVAEDEHQLTVSVTDKGVGMSEEHLSRVFDRYYRVHEHAIQFQGLGIGLYISYDIVLRHGGKMWVDSEIDKGSTFYFTLPFISV